MAGFLRAAEIEGPLRVRSWWRSSPVTMSLIQWRRLAMSQCPRVQAAICSGRAWSMGREQNRVDDLGGLLLAAAALVDGAGAADLDHLCGAGEVHPPGGLDGFEGASHPPPVGAVGGGDGRDVLPGRVLERLVQTGLFVLDRQQVVGAPGDGPLGRIHLGAPWRRR